MEWQLNSLVLVLKKEGVNKTFITLGNYYKRGKHYLGVVRRDRTGKKLSDPLREKFDSELEAIDFVNTGVLNAR